MSSVKLDSIRCFGLNLPADGGRSGSSDDDPIFVWLRQDTHPRIELICELSAENIFAAVPNMSGITVVTKGSNNSKKFKIILSGNKVTSAISSIARQADTKTVAMILKPYSNIHRQVRLEPANQGRRQPQGLEPVNDLMPINNLAIYGLNVPFATHKRTYIIGGIELMIVSGKDDRDDAMRLKLIDRRARLETIVNGPRGSIVAVRKGHRTSDGNVDHYIDWTPSRRLRTQHTISLKGRGVETLLAESRHLTSPREVLAAMEPLIRELRYNFRIKTG